MVTIKGVGCDPRGFAEPSLQRILSAKSTHYHGYLAQRAPRRLQRASSRRTISLHTRHVLREHAVLDSGSPADAWSNVLTPDQTTVLTSGATTSTSFPVASDVPIPGVYSSTSPDSPPAPGSPLVPDFGPAWEAAHAKA